MFNVDRNRKILKQPLVLRDEVTAQDAISIFNAVKTAGKFRRFIEYHELQG